MEAKAKVALGRELAVIPSLEDRIEALEETVRRLNGDLSELTALVHGIRQHIPGAIYVPPRGASRADGPVPADRYDAAHPESEHDGGLGSGDWMGPWEDR